MGTNHESDDDSSGGGVQYAPSCSNDEEDEAVSQGDGSGSDDDGKKPSAQSAIIQRVTNPKFAMGEGKVSSVRALLVARQARRHLPFVCSCAFGIVYILCHVYLAL